MTQEELRRKTQIYDEDAQIFEQYYRVYVADNGYVITMGDVGINDQSTYVFEDKVNVDKENDARVKLFFADDIFAMAKDVRLRDFKLTIRVEPIS